MQPDQEELNLSYHERRALGVEQSAAGEWQGVDPRKIQTKILEKIGHKKSPLLRVVQAACLDCAHSSSEIRKCTAVACPLWPYRMGTNPFKPERTPEQKEADRLAGDRLKKLRLGTTNEQA